MQYGIMAWRVAAYTNFLLFSITHKRCTAAALSAAARFGRFGTAAAAPNRTNLHGMVYRLLLTSGFMAAVVYAGSARVA